MNLKNLLTRTGFLILFLFAIASSTFAGTIFVNNQTGSNSNSGTQSAPKLDLDGVNGAIAAALSGDEIVVVFTGVNYASLTVTAGINKTLTFSSQGGSPSISTVTINYSNGASFTGPFRVGTLNLLDGLVTGAANLTIASGVTITKASGALDAAPTFAGSVSVVYQTNDQTTGFEMPASVTALNDLTVSGAITVTLSTTRTMNGTLVVNNAAGTLSLGGNTLTLSNTSNAVKNHNIQGTVSASSGGLVINAGGSTAGSSPVNIINNAPAAAGALPSITINAGGEVVTIGNAAASSNGPTVLNGNLVVNAGDVNVYSIVGNTTSTGITGSVSNLGTGTLTFDPAGTGANGTLRIGGDVVNQSTLSGGVTGRIDFNNSGTDVYNLAGSLSNIVSLSNTGSTQRTNQGNVNFAGQVTIDGNVTNTATFTGSFGSSGGYGGYQTSGMINFGSTAALEIKGKVLNSSSSTFDASRTGGVATDFSAVGLIQFATTGALALDGGVENNSSGFGNLGNGGLAPAVANGTIKTTGAAASVTVGLSSAHSDLLNTSTASGTGNGNIDFSSSSGTLVVNGGISMTGSGPNDILTTTGAVTVNGTVSNSRSNNNAFINILSVGANVIVGTINQTGTGRIVFAQTTGTISVNGDVNISNGQVTANSISANTGDISVTGNFNLSGGVFESDVAIAGADLSITGTLNLTDGRFNFGTAARTINVNGVANQLLGTIQHSDGTNARNTSATLVFGRTISAQSLSVAANSVWPGNLQIANSFPVGPVFSLEGNNLTVGGNVDFKNGGGEPLVNLNTNKLIMSGVGAVFTNNAGYTATGDGSMVMRADNQVVTHSTNNKGFFNIEFDPGSGNNVVVGSNNGTADTYVFNGFAKLTSGQVDANTTGNTDVISFNNTANVTPTIYRGLGILAVTPTFTSSVDVIYTSTDPLLVTSGELPTATNRLNNLTVSSAGGNQIVTVKTAAIASSTQATPIVVTTGASHGLATGDRIRIAGHDQAAANGVWVITVTGATTFSLNGSAAGANVGTAAGNVFVDPTVNGTLNVFANQTLALGGNILTQNGASIVNNGNLTSTAGGKIVLNRTAGTTISGTTALPDIDVASGSAGNVITGNPGITAGATDNLTFLGSGSLTATFTGDGPHIGGTLTTAGGCTFTLGANAIVGQNLIHNGGTINVQTFNLTVGAAQVASAHQIGAGSSAQWAGTGSVIFTNSAAGNSTLSATGASAKISIPAVLNMKNNGDQLTIQTNPLTFSNSLTLTKGALIIDQNINLTGNAFTLTGNATVSDNGGGEVFHIAPASGDLTATVAAGSSLPAVEVDGNTILAYSNSGAGLTVASLNHDAGNINMGSRDLTVTGPYDRDGGTYSATSGALVLQGTINQGPAFTIPNLTINNAGAIPLGDDLGMAVTGTFTLDNGGVFTHKPGTTARLNIAAGATVVYVAGNFDVAPVYGGPITLVAANSVSGTIPALVWPESATVTSLIIAGGTTVDLPGNRTVQDELNLSNGTLNLNTGNRTLTLANSTIRRTEDGALVYNGTNGKFVVTNAPDVIYEPSTASPGGDFTTGPELLSTVNSLTFTRSDNVGNAEVTVASNVTVNGNLVILNDVSTTGTISTKDTVKIATDDFSNATAPVTTFGAALNFIGDKNQVIALPGTVNLSNVTINKANNTNTVTLNGGNLNLASGGGVLTLTKGLLVTGDNYVQLSNPVGSIAQGFTRNVATGNVSHVVGNVRKAIKAGTVPAFGRNEFPVGDMTNYRPVAITTINALGNTALGVNVVANHVGVAPTGTVGLPIGNIARYPGFYWNISSDQSLGSTIFDLELTAEGFTDYQNVSDLRIIRRLGTAADVGNAWSLQGANYDNFTLGGVPSVRNINSTGGIIPQGGIFTYGLPSGITLVTPIADQEITVGGSAVRILLDGRWTGNTVPFTYSATSSNPAKVTVAVSGDTLIVTPVAEGTATINVKATSGLDFGNDDFVVTVKPVSNFRVTGVVTYDGTETPLPNVLVTIAGKSDSTDANGAYVINDVPNGTHAVTAVSGQPWWPADAGDALLVLKSVAHNPDLTGIFAEAADVSNDNVLTSLDALRIQRRDAGLDSTYPSGNWFFETGSVTVAGANQVANLQGISMGDVNGDASPVTAKASASVQVQKNAKLTANIGAAIQVPVTVGSAMSVNAMSLTLTYPAELAVYSGLSTKAEGITVNQTEGKIKISWASLSGLNLKENDVLFTLNFKTTNKFVAGSLVEVEIDNSSKLFDGNGNVVKAVLKSTPVEGFVPTEFALKQNYPNPFNPTTVISYDLPVAGNVSLVVFNSLGEEVTRLVNELQTPGTYKFNWNASGLTSGLYFYRIDVKAGDKSFTKTQKMMLLK